jgi:hypothetical protein
VRSGIINWHRKLFKVLIIGIVKSAAGFFSGVSIFHWMYRCEVLAKVLLMAKFNSIIFFSGDQVFIIVVPA